MQLVLDSTKVIPFLQRNKRTLAFFSVYAVLTALLILGAYIWGTQKPLFRDFYLANIAHLNAGPQLPFEEDEAGYTRGFKIDPDSIYSYGIESNNVWIAEYVRKIVPYFAYDKVTNQGIYPFSAASTPLTDSNSFHVGGRMYHTTNAIILNERYFIDDRWNDKRRALAVLVHELVHIQRNAYTFGASEELENATSTATVEVLAAMCNYGDDIACKAFWFNIENLARTSLSLQLEDLGLESLYEAWANTFWRSDAKTDAYNKSRRFWADSPGQLKTIQEKYYLGPWYNVIAGVTDGIKLNTMAPICNYLGECSVLGMPFDDTWYLMRAYLWIME